MNDYKVCTVMQKIVKCKSEQFDRVAATRIWPTLWKDGNA